MNQNSNFNQDMNYNNTYSNHMNYNFQQPPQQPFDVLGLVSMLCGILSLVFCCCTKNISLVLAIAAIVLAIIKKCTSNDKRFGGMAIAGLVCGILTFAIVIVLSVLLIIFFQNLDIDGLLKNIISALEEGSASYYYD